jgi:hypothetical protein
MRLTKDMEEKPGHFVGRSVKESKIFVIRLLMERVGYGHHWAGDSTKYLEFVSLRGGRFA